MPKTATFTISLSEVPIVPVSVNYATVDDTAFAGSDYVGVSGTVTFQPGETSKTVAVEVEDNTIDELDEVFRLVLSSPSNLTLGRSTGFCTIPGGGGGVDPEDPGAVTAGPLIKDGLITNAYHVELGRGGYFHPSSGTSEGQGVFIWAAYLAFEELDGGTTDEQTAADYFKDLAETMLDALGDGSGAGPMLRQAIPDDPNTITLLHWLFAARALVQLQRIVYTFHTVKTGSTLVIGESNRGKDVFRVWNIYPSTSYLLYNSPYSPAYDIASPAGETQVPVADTDWSKSGPTVTINMPSGANPAVPDWYVLYGYNYAGVLPQGLAYEAYPCWTAIEDGFAACAPDTFRWFELALSKAIIHDARPGNAAKWTKLRAAMRRTAVRGQAITDLREILKPLPGFAAIPASGEPSGMFCYSDHPSATPPTDPNLNQQWLGYNFWSRSSDGDLLGQVPAPGGGVPQVQIGRGFNDSWRTSTSYQDPDQYLYISICCTKKPTLPTEHVYVYVSSTKNYSGFTRWYADIGAYADFVAVTQTALEDGTGMIELLIPRTDFVRKDTDSAVLPAGTRFENFGVSVEIGSAFNVRIGAMRLVSGPTPTWVTDNFSKAIKGSQMPFFPGAMPFAINADTVKQQFVGFNGNPFHGYQLADFWINLGTDADAVFPGLVAGDLPIPDPSTGALTFPITANDTNADAKPKHALLMEQQLRFLSAAQEKWQDDGGDFGPFAHTFVINTPARASLGNPTPHTWVYTNDDPNTRWVGYQVRVVESLALVMEDTQGVAGFADCYNLARTMVVGWLTWLNTAWPNLSGAPYKGLPTDFDNPAGGPPQTLYEEPHSASLIIRSALFLKDADPTQTTLCDALILRAWQYLEIIYVTAPGEMQYTWSTNPTDKLWYGFWHGEIIAAICFMLARSGDLPVGIDTADLRLRLVQTKGWLTSTGVQTS